MKQETLYPFLRLRALPEDRFDGAKRVIDLCAARQQTGKLVVNLGRFWADEFPEVGTDGTSGRDYLHVQLDHGTSVSKKASTCQQLSSGTQLQPAGLFRTSLRLKAVRDLHTGLGRVAGVTWAGRAPWELTSADVFGGIFLANFAKLAYRRQGGPTSSPGSWSPRRPTWLNARVPLGRSLNLSAASAACAIRSSGARSALRPRRRRFGFWLHADVDIG